MKVFNKVPVIVKYIENLKLRNLSIGFVPTMGALHDGHFSLIKKSLSDCDITIVSIFVNPTQFGINEDLNNYPRTLDKDLTQLRSLDVDVVFLPAVNDIYPFGTENSIMILENNISNLYCGASRPGHFKGVLSVVLRFFNIIRPDKAYFGEKDYQQFFLIKKMVKDLFFNIEVIECPIIREKSGLAMSSRNKYLSLTELNEASWIYKTLIYGQEIFEQGEIDPNKLIRLMRKHLLNNTKIKIDFLEIVDNQSFLKSKIVKKGDRILFAGYLNNTRLIDNLLL